MDRVKLSGYSLLKLISTGGFAEVWLAEKNNSYYAVKIPKIDVQKTLSQRDVEEFVEKAEVWSKLKHKNIVKIFEYGAKPFPHIVMEYCDRNLREKINEVTIDEALNIALKVAEALEYAHLHGVVHRDIKPENILICRGEPKISDWGIAKVLLKATTRTGYTGTPLYSAPEQLDPETYGASDWRTDIWQLGCLIYEMVEKEPPYYAEYPGQLALKILTKPPREFKKTPEWLKQIIIKCLAKRKEKRWRSISLVIQALQQRQKQITERVTIKGLKKRIEGYEFPDDLYYHPDHMWAKVEDGKVRVGYNDWAQGAAGKILFIRTKKAGQPVKQGKTLGTIESGKWVGPLRSPVSGKIVEVNGEVQKNPSLINEDPYGKGWIAVIEPTNLEEELKNLIPGSDHAKLEEWLKKELEKWFKKELENLAREIQKY